jgi:hypothetical protein
LRFGGLFRERSLYESRAVIRAYRGLRRIAARAGLDVLLRTFYSPVPHLDDLRPDAFERVSELPGVRWDLDAQLHFLRDMVSIGAKEFRPPPASAPGSDRYAADNPSYGILDATVHYGLIRSLKPRRVVELGSGHSTLVTAEAGGLNGAEGSPLTLDVYDPFPGVVREGLPGLHALHRTPAQEVPLRVFEALEEGDVLFVDTTHTVKIGSEVNFVLLEVLPRLRVGVVVHFHDIYLPFEYPRSCMEDFALYWNEQYLLQAFLAHNQSWDVLLAVQALSRLRRSELAASLSPEAVAQDGAGFWMRRAR